VQTAVGKAMAAAKMAKGIRREEERMAKFLEGQIKSLTGAVVFEEIPGAQRSSSSGRKRSTSARKPPAKTPGETPPGQSQTCAKESPCSEQVSIPIERRDARRRSVGLPGLKI
jgi:hypothetical protein